MFLPLLSPFSVYPLIYLSMRPWETFSLLFCGKTYFFSRRIWSPRVRRFFSSAAERASRLLAGSHARLCDPNPPSEAYVCAANVYWFSHPNLCSGIVPPLRHFR